MAEALIVHTDFPLKRSPLEFISEITFNKFPLAARAVIAPSTLSPSLSVSVLDFSRNVAQMKSN